MSEARSRVSGAMIMRCWRGEVPTWRGVKSLLDMVRVVIGLRRVGVVIEDL